MLVYTGSNTASGSLIQARLDGHAFVAAAAKPVFETRYFVGSARAYDVSPDGKRFLMIKEDAAAQGGTPGQRVTLVQNWFEELKQKVPAK